MATIVPTELHDGSPLEPFVINYLLRQIARWNKLSVSPPLALDNDGQGPPSLMFFGPEGDLIPVYFTSGITAGSYTTPTSATVTLLIEASDGPGFTTSGGDTATCYNIYTTAIGSGKVGWAKWRGPYLYAVVADC